MQEEKENIVHKYESLKISKLIQAFSQHANCYSKLYIKNHLNSLKLTFIKSLCSVTTGK